MLWQFDACDRLSDLVERCQGTAEYLRRDRCDRLGDPRAVDAIDGRLAVLRGRLRRLQTRARRARRVDRAWSPAGRADGTGMAARSDKRYGAACE